MLHQQQILSLRGGRHSTKQSSNWAGRANDIKFGYTLGIRTQRCTNKLADTKQIQWFRTPNTADIPEIHIIWLNKTNGDFPSAIHTVMTKHIRSFFFHLPLVQLIEQHNIAIISIFYSITSPRPPTLILLQTPCLDHFPDGLLWNCIGIWSRYSIGADTVLAGKGCYINVF